MNCASRSYQIRRERRRTPPRQWISPHLRNARRRCISLRETIIPGASGSHRIRKRSSRVPASAASIETPSIRSVLVQTTSKLPRPCVRKRGDYRR